ncbi:hypothetical protein K501DRAFT_86912 [Backusella circina FSU 941]|nr:hypothetical protein K501DRAFT_86912 [Backusella circina FSU 941]
MIPLGTKAFERILDFRRNEQTGQDELLIKYKNMSFLHVEWVPLEQIEGEHLGKHRVKKFMQKYHQDGNKGEDFKEYLKMDRVIDDGELEDPTTGESRIYYLVKWNGMFYDQATWETEESVRRVDSTKLDEFISRKQIPQEKLMHPPPRPDMTRFIQYNQSPSFRYGNSLRPYQLEGLNWLRFCYFNYRSSILADEMGLGKTVQSVAFLNDIYYNLGVRGPFLIIAPLSTIPHWTRAFSAWTDLNVIDYRGSTMARSLIMETEFHYQDMEGRPIPQKYKFDVLITTYEMASAGAPTLKDIPWRCGIFDEAHRLKNKNSKVLEVLKTFYMDHKLLLTGTPLQNNLDELYSLLHFMQPDIFNDERYFFAEYGDLKSATEVEKLQALLKPIMLRRFKEDVEKTIPVKEETVIEVELTNPQKKWYRAILERNFSFLKKGGKSNKEMPHLRNIMMQLRKCCIHPYLLEGAEEVIVSECNARNFQEQFNCLVQSSGKLVLIDKLLRKLIQGNHKVLIFSQFTSCLDILADYLRGRSYAYERIDGSVPGDQRQAAIDRFSTLPIEESFVFLLCTRAGGVGINLTAADTCIIFDSDWNPQNDLQAQARCHRIGQTKPVQIYRLICANTYEKDMFDRAGMKLGLDKAVMGTHDDGSANKSTELNRQEIEDLLKKGAYGAMLNDEESAKFCEEDIDQILERRTKVIKHEGNEKGSVFSKATFSAAVDGDSAGVDLDDPDFWEKWAAKANIDTTEVVDHDSLIVAEPRRRRQVQRFGSRPGDGAYSSNDNADDSDAAYDDDLDKSSRKRDQIRPWSLSEKTKYERKLMIYGYGSWDLMKAHFPRRSERDLKSVTRALMRKVLPQIEQSNEEDRKLVEDTNDILEQDAREDARKNDMPYPGANKKEIAEYKSFLIQAPADYIEHIERKGRNFLLRIQMLHLIRDKIVPKDWEQAKALAIPKVTGSPPVSWWGEDEDRSLLLGIYKHGYQQYLAMRNDPEFSFYGKKFDDSQSGGLEDEDAPLPQNSPEPATKKLKRNHDDSDYEDIKEEEEDLELEGDDEGDDSDDELGKKRRKKSKSKRKKKEEEEDEEVYVWPSKADIGMRLRRIIAAFLRERANDMRKLKLMEKVQKKENDRRTRQRQKESRVAQRQRVRHSEASNRWSKKNRSDFLRTLLSFGVERNEDEEYEWGRFKEIAGLEKKTDDSLTLYYEKIFVACEESVKRHQSEPNNNQVGSSTDAADKNDENAEENSTIKDLDEDENAATTKEEEITITAPTNDVNSAAVKTEISDPVDGDASASAPLPLPTQVAQETEPSASRESSVDPTATEDNNKDDADNGETVPYDRARRALKRVEQMKTIREKVLVNSELDLLLLGARKTSGLPSWWEVPAHDRALLEGISKHGFGRSDLLLEDAELPFYHIKQGLIEEYEESNKNLDGDEAAPVLEKLAWPKDIIIARRIDSLCELVLNPKPLSKRQNRKRKLAVENLGNDNPPAKRSEKINSTANNGELSSNINDDTNNDEYSNQYNDNTDGELSENAIDDNNSEFGYEEEELLKSEDQ